MKKEIWVWFMGKWRDKADRLQEVERRKGG